MSSIYRDVAMLTRLRIEMPQMTVKDKDGTSAAEDAFGAHNAGVYRKNLYPKHLIDPITSLSSSARAYMYSQTRPCGYSGLYLLPNRRIMGYLDQMGKYEVAFWQAVTAFLNNWSNVLQEAQNQQGGMFDPSVYPDLANLKAQFVFEYPITNVPNGADQVSKDLEADVVDVVKTKLVQADTEANAQIISAAYKDLREQVLRIVKQTTLVEKANKKGEVEVKPGKIYETLTTDIKDIANLLADLQFGGDPKLQEIVEEVDTHLAGMPAQALRDNPDVCKITHERAKSILTMLDGSL